MPRGAGPQGKKGEEKLDPPLLRPAISHSSRNNNSPVRHDKGFVVGLICFGVDLRRVEILQPNGVTRIARDTRGERYLHSRSFPIARERNP